MRTLSLEGVGILITRAAEQSEGMSRALEELGATSFVLPTIQCIPFRDPAGLNIALEKISSYEALIFTSVNGVRFFVNHLREARMDMNLIPPAVCVGPRTAEAWRVEGGRVFTVPDEYTGEMILDTLGEDLSGKIYLILRPETVRTELGEALRDAGAVVDEIVLYKTQSIDTGRDELKQLLAHNSIDIITFTSPSSVQGLAHLLGSLREVREIPCICVGPTTAVVAEQEGMKKVFYPEEYTVDGMLRMLPTLIGEGSERR